MPTTTFFNLPPPKRERLIRAAMAEFSRKSFGDASINRIIQDAGISRGSFYQYFADKSDLFRYVLRCYDRQLEAAVTASMERCGARPMELPLALFDLVLAHIRERWDEFAQFLSILRQNIGMDAGQLLPLSDIIRLVLERADWSGLCLEEAEERLALLDLLLSSTGQSLMAVCCGKATREEVRERLANKIRIVRQGAEIKEEPECSNSTTL